MPQPLEYGRPKPFPSIAVVALVCGIMSGPLALVAGLLGSGTSVAFALFGIVLIIFAVVCCVIQSRLPADVPAAARLITSIGVMFPVGYGIVWLILFWLVVR